MVADNIHQFAWTADAEGWIYWYNQRWYDYTGTTLEEMQGWGWKQVHHPDHVDRVVARIQHSWNTGEPWEDTFPLRGKDGQYRWFLSRALPIRDSDGKVLRWFGTNTDITEHRELEQRIQVQAAQLATESRRKDEFLAMLGHELRNPLAPIRSAVHLLKLRERPGNEDAIQRVRPLKSSSGRSVISPRWSMICSKLDVSHPATCASIFSPRTWTSSWGTRSRR